MEAYQQRVVEEKAELDSKIEKLAAFLLTDIYAKLNVFEQDLLDQQLKYMRGYSFILEQRILRFNSGISGG